MENFINNLEQQEKFGCNVKILVKFIRHGEKDKNGNLLDLGREVTKEKTRISGIDKNDFDAIKATGSNAAPVKEDIKMGRALETADIYATEIAGDEKFKTRVNDILNYETLKNPIPFNYREVYNNSLPDNFEQLTEEERVKAAKIAQITVVNHLINLNNVEADNYKREIAGSFSYIIKHYQEMTKRLYSKSKILILAGTHSGTMEFLLQKALVIKDDVDREKIGFNNINEIGGEFDPSDSYNINIQTDNTGKLKELKVSFDNIKRPQSEMFLDTDKVSELSEVYKNLHDLK